MAFRRPFPETPRVELTAMIDVVFLLLIFFMISTTFVDRPGLEVDLPDSTAPAMAGEEKEVRIYLGKAGEIFFNQQRLSLEQLRQQLESYGSAAARMTFLLMADKGALHGKVIQLMDVAKSAGFSQLAIATSKQIEN